MNKHIPISNMCYYLGFKRTRDYHTGATVYYKHLHGYRYLAIYPAKHRNAEGVIIELLGPAEKTFGRSRVKCMERVIENIQTSDLSVFMDTIDKIMKNETRTAERELLLKQDMWLNIHQYPKKEQGRAFVDYIRGYNGSHTYSSEFKNWLGYKDLKYSKDLDVIKNIMKSHPLFDARDINKVNQAFDEFLSRSTDYIKFEIAKARENVLNSILKIRFHI